MKLCVHQCLGERPRFTRSGAEECVTRHKDLDFKDEYAVKYKMLRYCMDYTKNICGTDWKVYKEGKLK